MAEGRTPRYAVVRPIGLGRQLSTRAGRGIRVGVFTRAGHGAIEVFNKHAAAGCRECGVEADHHTGFASVAR